MGKQLLLPNEMQSQSETMYAPSAHMRLGRGLSNTSKTGLDTFLGSGDFFGSEMDSGGISHAFSETDLAKLFESCNDSSKADPNLKSELQNSSK